MDRAGVPLAAIVSRGRRGRDRVRRLLPEVPTAALTGRIPAAQGMLIAVPDHAIGSCATRLMEGLVRPPRVVLHTSGLLPAEVLAPLRPLGCHLGSLHPLMTFPSATGQLVVLAGALATVEGDEAAVRAARRLARRLGLVPAAISPARKARYHAAAALAANLTHILVAVARDELVAAGLTPPHASAALRPLLEATVANALAARGLERLTGPLTRGDVATIQAHLEAQPPDVAAAYRAVAALAVARLRATQTLSAQAAHGLDAALTSPGHCGSFAKMGQSEGA